MTTYYVSDTGNNAAGTSWATAKTTLAGAIALATASGDVILVDKDHTGDNALAADTTWTVLNNIAIVCVDKDNSDALATMGEAAWLGSSTTSVTLVLGGAYRCRVHGITLRNGGSLNKTISVGFTDGAHLEMSDVTLWLGTTSGAAYINLGPVAVSNAFVYADGLTVIFGTTGQSITAFTGTELRHMTVSASGTAPSALFEGVRGGIVRLFDCDLSYCGSNSLVGQHSTGQPCQYELTRCKLGANYVALESQSPGNKGAASVMLRDCSSGDTHGIMHYADAFGSVVSDAGIYYTTGAAAQSWKVTTTANCSPATPFVTPWIAAYHSGVSSITPRLEILRDGSATAYQDDEVWSEWSAKVTSGTVLGTSYSDGMPLLGTPANQAAGAGTGAWTGENATAWSGKCDSGAAFTPAETGEILARLVVGEPSITVYLDPQIRTA